jgi:hypothetical protein
MPETIRASIIQYKKYIGASLDAMSDAVDDMESAANEDNFTEAKRFTYSIEREAVKIAETCEKLIVYLWTEERNKISGLPSLGPLGQTTEE